MKISEVIQTVKNYHKGIRNGKRIDDTTTKDKVLYGDTDRECTGIVTTCFASTDVIKKAKKLGANFIICHEALFWNHGDHTDWLADNHVFQAKAQLLNECGITVWRDHDYIHSGIPVKDIKGGYSDGIFYGFAKIMGWDKYIINDASRPVEYEFPEIRTAEEIAKEMISKINLTGIRLYGDPQTKVKRAWVCGHIFGPTPEDDNAKTAKAEKDGFDLLIPLECYDTTTSEYIRDASYLGCNKALLSCGHFNTEEPGMKYMTEWLPQLVNIPVHFIQSGDSYSYIIK